MSRALDLQQQKFKKSNRRRSGQFFIYISTIVEIQKVKQTVCCTLLVVRIYNSRNSKSQIDDNLFSPQVLVIYNSRNSKSQIDTKNKIQAPIYLQQQKFKKSNRQGFHVAFSGGSTIVEIQKVKQTFTVPNASI